MFARVLNTYFNTNILKRAYLFNGLTQREYLVIEKKLLCWNAFQRLNVNEAKVGILENTTFKNPTSYCFKDVQCLAGFQKAPFVL